MLAALAALPPLPAHWPHRVDLGLTDSPGGAGALHRSVPKLRFRYQYLAGGVNTGEGWRTWNQNGTFVDLYVKETRPSQIPVFSYYMIRQSLPGRNNTADEQQAVLDNLKNSATMKSWIGDITALFKHAGRFPKRTVVLQVEPDMWGYGEHAAKSDDAKTVPVARVGNLSGLARRVIHLRNQYAPNVIVAYHQSDWGTNVDLTVNDPSLDQSSALGRKAARFYRSLNAKFDLTFTDWSDRDSAFKRIIYGESQRDAWWTGTDFTRWVRFIRAYVSHAHQRVAVWQLPLGNRIMRAMDNTWGHFQDNKVQWLLGTSGREHLKTLRAAGAVAYLFGGGADGTTCACDAQGDGTTNPKPVDGNDRRSYSADDDGGYFRHQAHIYYARPLGL